MTLDWSQRKEMFAMQGHPYLNTPLHRAKGIKQLIVSQAVFDVLDGELPRDAGWITLSLAVDGMYPLGASRSRPGVYMHVFAVAFVCAFYKFTCITCLFSNKH